MKPSDDPKADKLINSNLNQPEEQLEIQEKEPTNFGKTKLSDLPDF